MGHTNTQPIPEERARNPFWCRNHKGESYTYEASLALIREFHGHPAPGLVIGVKMVTLAMAQLDEEVLFDAVCETHSCLPDAIQMLSRCTIGNGWLKVTDLGRFALTLYDKGSGKGVRVFLDPKKLGKWPEFYSWFYKRKPKKDQDFPRLMDEIRNAGDAVVAMNAVRIKSEYLVRRSHGEISTCPMCGEAYPRIQGGICSGCRGESPYETTCVADTPEVAAGPVLAVVPAEQAVGRRLLHDMTQIIPGREKGPAFRKGQTILPGDICRLQKMGRQQVYVDDDAAKPEGWVHEDEAAMAFANAIAGEGVCFTGPPREGKVSFTARYKGVLWVDTPKLEAFNSVPGVMCATRKRYTVLAENEKLAASRAIPLFLPEHDFQVAMAGLSDGPLLKVLPMRRAKIGILVTGTEVFRGLIQDRFVPIIRSKAEQYGCDIVDAIITPDDRVAIREGVRALLNAGADLLVTTAGLSVDPDDVTKQGLMDAGCREIIYGAPILPGAMTLIARMGDAQVIGVPACGLYHDITSFDLLFPRLLAGLPITRQDMAEIGHGGFCMECSVCIFPQCAFGR